MSDPEKSWWAGRILRALTGGGRKESELPAAEPDDLPFPRLRARGVRVNELREEIYAKSRGRKVIVIGGMSGVPSKIEPKEQGDPK